MACGILVSPPGTELTSPALEVPSLNHWTAREVSPEGLLHSRLQCPSLENPLDGETWRAAIHGVAKSQTQLSNWAHTHAAEEPGIVCGFRRNSRHHPESGPKVFLLVDHRLASQDRLLSLRAPTPGEFFALPKFGGNICLSA